MDQNDRFSSQKSEPSLDAADAFSTEPPAATLLPPASRPPVTPSDADSAEAGDMPAWLNQPGESAPASSGWQRTGLWVGGLAIVIAGAAAGSNWLLQEYETRSAASIKEPPAQADVLTTVNQPPLQGAPAAALPVIPPKQADAVPPLVLLPPEQGGKPKEAPPAADAAAPAAPAATSAPVTAANTAPVTAPVAAPPAADKPSAAVPAAASKAGAATTAVPKTAAKPGTKPGARPAAAKKKPVLAKRTAPKPVRGTTLPAPRAREEAKEDGEREAGAGRRCIPGELARECEARLKQR